LVGGIAGFITAEDLGDIAEFLDAVDDGTFEEAVRQEIISSQMDVVIDCE
jgi:hypothetical protein